MQTAADRLRSARVRKGIPTATEAARLLGINKQTYQNYEDGARGFAKHLIKLAKFYGVRPQWLMNGELPIASSDIQTRLNSLDPADQAKVFEYVEMLEAKSTRR